MLKHLFSMECFYIPYKLVIILLLRRVVSGDSTYWGIAVGQTIQTLRNLKVSRILIVRKGLVERVEQQRSPRVQGSGYVLKGCFLKLLVIHVLMLKMLMFGLVILFLMAPKSKTDSSGRILPRLGLKLA